MPRSTSPPSHKNVKKKQNIINELHCLLPIPHINKKSASKVEITLEERTKELKCLYGISMLAEGYGDFLHDMLGKLVQLFAFLFAVPEIACARIVINGKTYTSRRFKETKWRQSSQISVNNEHAGEVEVFYLKECPPQDEGPFLKEERLLIDAVAERIGNIARRISAEKKLREMNKQLELEHKTLRETNAALRVVLTRIEEEKRNISTNIQSNVEKILMPIINALSSELPEMQRNYLDLLRRNLDDLVSPFINSLSRRFLSLTPKEIKICNMIRNGLRTKDIARMQGVSVSTINCHREHIRQKLKITNREINLATFLQSNMWEEEL